MATTPQNLEARAGTASAITRAGVGVSERASSREAGAEAARMALASAGLEACDLALVFCTGKHDPHAFHAGVRSVMPAPARIIGGYTIGVITNEFLGYEGLQVAVAALKLGTAVESELFLQEGLNAGETEAGAVLGARLRAAGAGKDADLLLLYDMVRGEGFSFNMATPLLRGLRGTIGAWPRTAGVGMLGDAVANPTHQFFDDRVLDQSAIALLLRGGVRMDTTIMHGCKPSGTYHTVTRAEHNAVLEIDGRPALDAVKDIVGSDLDQELEEYPFFLTLGENHGDKWDEFREENYSNHICAAIDEDRRALIMFEPNLTAGTEIQLMRRTMEFEYVRERTQQVLDGLEGRRPFFAFYIDCAIRASAFCGSDGEEAAEVQRALGEAGIPLLGIYTGTEIAEIRGEPRPLDYTGVLCVFSEEVER